VQLSQFHVVLELHLGFNVNLGLLNFLLVEFLQLQPFIAESKRLQAGEQLLLFLFNGDSIHPAHFSHLV